MGKTFSLEKFQVPQQIFTKYLINLAICVAMELS